MTARVLIVAAALTLAACGGTGLTLNGEVTRKADSTPLEGARVSMSCPKDLQASGLSLMATTDRAGHVSHREPAPGRSLRDGCEIFVTADGFEHVAFPIENVCRHWAADRCVDVYVRARLEPDAGVAPGRGIRLVIEVKQEGQTIHTEELVAPIGRPATVTLKRDGVPYRLVVVPTWISDTSVSLNGTWSVGAGSQGPVAEVTNVGEPITVSFGSDEVLMRVTPQRE